MKIGQKLIGSFAIVAMIGAIIGGVGWYGIGVLEESMDQIASVRLPAVDALLTMDAKMGDVATAQMELLNPKVPVEEAQEFYQSIEVALGEAEENVKKFEKLIMDDTERKMYVDVMAAFTALHQASDEFVNFSKDLDGTGIRNPVQVKYDIKNIEAAHRNWIFQLSETVIEGLEFKGQLDPTQCALGKWMANYDLDNEVIKNSFTFIKEHHDKFHNSGKTIKEIFSLGKGKSQKDQAMVVFDDVSIPAMDLIINQLKYTMEAEADKANGYYDAMLKVEGNSLNPTFTELMDALGDLVHDVHIGAKESQEAGDAAVASSETLILTSIILGMLVALGFGFIIARNISKPIQEIAGIADEIALGNINHDINIKSKDEVGMLANSFNELINYMQELAQIADSIAHNDLSVRVDPKSENDALGNSFESMVKNLKTVVKQLSGSSTEVASAATEISASAEQVSKNAQSQEMQISQITAAVEEMAATIVESSQNASEATSGAQSASDTASTGGQIVSETIEGMNRIANVVQESSTNIHKLAESAEQIGEIISVIDDIADQTNLLALNAAIEAARAGEQGRGFAVVADEVRKLAERTGKATGEITDMIKGIQKGTEEAVTSMDQGNQEVNSGRELADKAGDSLTEVVNKSQDVMNMIMQIATATEEQSAAAEEISKNVEMVSTATRESATGAEQAATAATQLSHNAEELQSIVGQFKLE